MLLGTVLEWMRANGLSFNPDKMEILRVGCPSKSGLGNSPSFGGVTLPTNSEVRSLGICLNPDLTMETQVASVVHSAYFHLWRIAQLRPYLDVGALTALVHAFVVLRLDYCNALYGGATFEIDAEASNGAQCGSQSFYWGEKTSTYLPYSGCPALAAHSFPH